MVHLLQGQAEAPTSPSPADRHPPTSPPHVPPLAPAAPPAPEAPPDGPPLSPPPPSPPPDVEFIKMKTQKASFVNGYKYLYNKMLLTRWDRASSITIA